MKRTNELYCLKSVKEAIQNPYAEPRIIYSAEEVSNKNIVEKIIKTAYPNQLGNEFPDFLCQDGLIEHFEVTSSKENMKGAEFRKNDRHFKKECDCARDNLTANDFDQGRIIVQRMEMPELTYSHDNFVKSFKRNFSNHIKRLNSYAGIKTNSFFLIESAGATFKVLKKNEYIGEIYLLKYDKILLEYLYQHRDVLRYVIFTHSNYFEIIELDNIPQLLKKLNDDISFEAGRMKNVSLNLQIDI